jgi:TRAP-type transport system periplasmic protein
LQDRLIVPRSCDGPVIAPAFHVAEERLPIEMPANHIRHAEQASHRATRLFASNILGGKMKIVRSVAGVAIAATALAFVSSSQAQTVSLTMGSAINAGHASSKAMEIFKAEVARRSKNAIDIQLVPDMKLGGALDIVQKVRADGIFATWVATTFLARLLPQVDAVNLPFVFRNYEDAIRTVDGPVGKLIEAQLDAKGFTTLAWMELGARTVENSKRPLKTIDDFKDLKIRVQPSEILTATFRALGATPIAVDTKDNYAALQNGDMDGMEVPYSIVSGYRFSDYLKYVSDTDHLLELVVLVANKKAFMRLTPEQQKAVRDAARVAALQQRKMADEGEKAALADLQAKGLQFDPVPSETRLVLRKAADGVIGRMKKRIGPELVDKVIAEAEHRGKP